MAKKRGTPSFQEAIETAEHLKLVVGLGAIKRSEGAGQIDTGAANLQGSVAMDDDCRSAYPTSARWDYVIGTRRQRGDVAYFVEVHSAETSEVSKMTAKLDWLMEFLARDQQAPLARLQRAVHWIASGRINIPKHTRQYKLLKTTLAQRGLIGPSKQLTLE